MKNNFSRCLSFLTFIALTLGAMSQEVLTQTPAPSQSAIDQALQKAVRFEENMGQNPQSEILYQAHSQGYSVRLLKDRSSVAVAHTDENGKEGFFVWNKVFPGMNPDARIEAANPYDTKINYRQPDGSSIQPKTYADIFYRDIYQGIDLRYYNRGDGGIEYDFVVDPGVDYKSIEMALEGILGASVDAENGELVMESVIGELRQSAPLTYQLVDGQRVVIESKFIVNERGHIGFEVAEYDRSLALVIDPTTLVHSTVIPGGGHTGRAMTVGPEGVYLAGNISSSQGVAVPTTPGVVHPGFPNVSTAFIVQLSHDLSTLIMGTYATTPAQQGTAFVDDIKVDDTGIYLLGTASGAANLSVATTPNSFQPFPTGLTSAYLQKYSLDGSALIYGTHLSGNEEDGAAAMDVHNGLVYLTGFTFAGEFPTTPGAWQESAPSGETFSSHGLFLIVDPDPTLTNGADLKYATFVTGEGQGETRFDAFSSHIEVAPDGTVWMGGGTQAAKFPTTPDALAPIDTEDFEGNGFLLQFADVASLGNGDSDVLYSTGFGADPDAFESVSAIHFAPDGFLYVGVFGFDRMTLPAVGSSYRP